MIELEELKHLVILSDKAELIQFHEKYSIGYFIVVCEFNGKLTRCYTDATYIYIIMYMHTYIRTCIHTYKDTNIKTSGRESCSQGK